VAIRFCHSNNDALHRDTVPFPQQRNLRPAGPAFADVSATYP
jgi:hypothetical protein